MIPKLHQVMFALIRAVGRLEVADTLLSEMDNKTLRDEVQQALRAAKKAEEHAERLWENAD